MAKSHKPRSGTLQFWPRKRAKRIYPRIRSWTLSKDVKPLAFAGYKVGMTHIIYTDNKSTSMTKGEDISIPITIIECPPLKIASIIFYKKTPYGLTVSARLNTQKFDKELFRKITNPKKSKEVKEDNFDDIRILVYTQPKLTTIGKKKPELFEIALGGNKDEKLTWAKENLGKELKIQDIFQAGQFIDIRGITKGKGFCGPVKRNGVSLRSHKSEKMIRGPANLGCWIGNRQWTVAQPGQHGFHQRMELNKWIVNIGEDPKEINKISGFKRYGVIKNNYLLVKGSIPGPSKRLIVLTSAVRKIKNIPDAPTIQYINK